jgi:tetratricopeptide (TPR) repeat protein
MIIQPLIILVGIFVLGSIFFRRYMILERGLTSFSFFKRKKNVLDLLRLNKGRAALEVTVDEMIPEPSTIDAKKVAKAGIMEKKAGTVLAKGDLKQAEQLLIQALALDPSNIDTYHKLGLLYLRQGQFGKAEMMYQKLVTSAKNDPVYFSNLAVALYQQKKLDEAKSNYRKAIELDSSRAGRFFSLAQVLQELGEVQEALGHFRKAIEMDPGNLDYLLTLAQVYMEVDMMDDARALLGEILAAYPENAIAREMMEKAAGNGNGQEGKEEKKAKKEPS